MPGIMKGRVISRRLQRSPVKKQGAYTRVANPETLDGGLMPANAKPNEKP